MSSAADDFVRKHLAHLLPRKPEEIAAELLESMRGDREEKEELRQQLRQIFMDKWGLRPSKASQSTAVRSIFGIGSYRSVFGRIGPYLNNVGGKFDHTEVCKGLGGYVILTQPYDVTEKVKEEQFVVAERWGARVEFPDFPSWWYPNNTTLIMWSR